jgi:hypothetical protein
MKKISNKKNQFHRIFDFIIFCEVCGEAVQKPVLSFTVEEML